MSSHKAPSQVTVSSGERDGELHELVRKHWKIAGLLVGVTITGILVQVGIRERGLQTINRSWDRLRRDVHFTFGFGVELPSQAVIGGLEEELSSTDVGPWVKALRVGQLLEEGKYEPALEAANAAETTWPNHPISQTAYYGLAGSPRQALNHQIRTAMTGLRTFEETRPDLFANPTPPEGSPRVRLDTSKGSLTVVLLAEQAPRHVENFLLLCKSGYYNGSRIHKVIPGQYVEGGDPNSKTEDSQTWGAGGPGYTIAHEESWLWNRRYAVTSVPEGDNYTSNGSQFRIVASDLPSLDGTTTVFGVIVEGADALDRIGEVELSANRPIEPVAIQSATLLE